jgi:PAS domain S-box-containing protein
MRPEARRLFHKLFQDSGDAAYLMDPADDCIIEANAAGCALLGYTRDELLVSTVSDIHPAEMSELRELLDRTLRDGRASTVRLTCRMKSGHFLPTEIALHVVESGGRRYLLGLVRDRSDHRERADPHSPH